MDEWFATHAIARGAELLPCRDAPSGPLVACPASQTSGSSIGVLRSRSAFNRVSCVPPPFTLRYQVGREQRAAAGVAMTVKGFVALGGLV
jgi:hypothetical protein